MRQAKAAVTVRIASMSAGERLLISPFEDCVEQLAGAEPHRVVRRQAGLGRRGRDRRSRLVLRYEGGVESDAGDLRRAELQRHPLVEVDELSQARDGRMCRVSFDLGPPHLVAE